MGYRFVTSRQDDKIRLVLEKDDGLMIGRGFRMDMSPDQARILIGMLKGTASDIISASGFNMTVVHNDFGSHVLIDDGGSYLVFNVTLIKSQTEDLASVMSMYVGEFEMEESPGSGEIPMDDRIDDDDPADYWKRGVRE